MLRFLFSLLCIGLGIFCCLFVDFRLGIVFFIVGAILMVFSEKSRGEKSGYHF